MASIDCSYMMFEETFKKVVDHWKLDGQVTKHNDFRNYLIGILFRFQDRYLSINDVINFCPDTPRKEILDITVKHIKEIKTQFYAYFNAIWG